ncbi:hypothetical protein E2C01_049869 [Portunus trituberculatus]|uniref:Uncharacterized protein n=1 Tax=Portunus trituberculatus TaxID=210409 RepID=A0A5B7GF12_PORTR|nr:hypothetical protein [Portunus trituberculatus]
MKQPRTYGKVAYFRHTKLIIKDRVCAPAQRVTGAAGGSANASTSRSTATTVLVSGGDASSSTSTAVSSVRGSSSAAVGTSGRGGAADVVTYSTPAGTLGHDDGDVGGGVSTRGSVTQLDIDGAWKPGKGLQECSPTVGGLVSVGTAIAKDTIAGRADGSASVTARQRATKALSSSSSKK